MDLIIDTSSEELKTILVKDKDYFVNKNLGTKHLEHLLPEIDRILIENKKSIKDIDCFCVVVGPGSFTGVRIGVSTVKAFACAFDRAKIIPINMLDLLAYTIKNAEGEIKNNFGIIIKSTSTKYYFGLYDNFGKNIYQKLVGKEELEKIEDPIYSYNFEEVFNNNKTRKLILMTGNYVSFVSFLKENNNFVDKKDLKPVYLALSQAEIELQKKEKEEKC